MSDSDKRIEKLSPLKRALFAVEEMRKKLEKLQNEKREPIAVIGMGCKFPKANGVDEYWDLLKNGIDAITEVPKGRWDVDKFYSPEAGEKGKMTTRYGGFIDDVDKFDPQFFGISPREAAGMDPQQRLLLQVVWQAFENAGVVPSSVKGSKTGVFIGISNNDYSKLPKDKLKNIDAYSGSGNAFSIAANRISYLLDFRGPSIALDTACSSSLVTIHMAIQSLRNKESDLAVAGGVNLILSPELTITFSQAHMMSPSGHCKTFSADADGYVRGEGCGVVILKRLSDAIVNNDNILAVIKGSAVNQDGKSNGLTAPNSFAQKNVILNALENANLNPEDIQYVETHGTGTILGDPIEVQALGMVMEKRGKENPCYLGSVKTNIGHLESASGIAGFIKTVLALKNCIIPKNLNFNQINPHIPINELPFEIPTEPTNWVTNGNKRRAGVSSFGFGGTNAHIVLEEYQKSDEDSIQNISDRDYHLLTMSAKSHDSLINLVNNYKVFLTKSPKVNLGDFCFTANCHKEHFEERVGFVADSVDNLSEKFDYFLSDPDDFIKTVKKIKEEEIAFLFTGQGSQYFGMGKVLYNTSPTFKKYMDKCNDILLPIINVSILDILFNDETKADLINKTAYTQPALFAIEYALSKLWMSWGIKPDYVIGHSVGEYTAATIAGLFSLEDGLKLIAKRGQLMQVLPQEGDMAVIFKDFEFVNVQIEEFGGDLSIAGVNGPENTVVSGKRASLNKLLENLNGQNVDYRKLTVSHAFHSPLMEPILDEFEETANTVEYHQPNIPIVSNVTGEIIDDFAKLNAKYWRNHIRKPVLFEPGIKKLAEIGCKIYLEVGPNPTLIGMAKRFMIDPKYIWIGSLKKKMNDWESLLSSISEVYSNGIKFNFRAFDSDYTRRFINIPTYSFLKERYWFEHGTNYLEDYTVSQKEPEKVIKEKGSWNEIVEKLKNDLQDSKIDKKVVLNNFIKMQIAKVLKLSKTRIKLNQSITGFGLDSILAMELRAKLFDAINIELPIAKLIEGPSIEELSEYLITQIERSDKNKIPPIKLHKLETGQFPLSYGQKAMWFQHKMAPDSIFNPAYAVKVKAKLNVEKLKNIFDTIIKKHPQLRTTFTFNNNEPVQIVHSSALEYFSEVNLIDLNDDEIKQRLENEANKQFDLEKGPLFKVFVFHTYDSTIILMVSHHIVVDMWSQAIIVNEVDKLYSSGANGFSLSEERAKYSDFVLWQKDILESEIGSELFDYWKNELSGELPVLDLPIDKQRPKVQTFNGATKTILLEKELSQQLAKLSKDNGTTLFVTLLSAFKILLNKYTGQKDIIVGTPTTGRSITDIENTVGYFVNPVAIRSKINEEETFLTYSKRLQTKVLGAIKHQDYPVNLLVEKLQPSRDTSRTPLFQAMFVYQKAQLLADEGLSEFSLGQEGSSLTLGELPLESITLDDKKAPFEITLMMAQTKNGLGASITYNTDLFYDISIDKMLDRLKMVLHNIVEHPKSKILNIQILNKIELDRIINNWNDTYVPRLNYKNIIEWFYKQVEISPDNRAVVFNNQSISFKELNDQSNRLANYLIRKGLKPDQLIGICIERSIEMITAVLAVLKAGAAYVPIDCNYPSKRIHYIISNAKISTMITMHGLSERFSDDGTNNIYLDTESEEILKEDVENVYTNILPENLAYAIYTSGSTGNPKGVLITHEGLMNLVYAQIQRFKISKTSRILQFASFSFDASVSEIFTSLLSGAELHLIRNEELLSGITILNKIKNEKITNCTLPPSVLKVLSKDELPSLEVVVSAGEACSKEIILNWANGRKFINAYGPTESTVCAACHEVKTIPNSNIIPIGKPIDNIKIYILDNHLRPVPIGLQGELYIGGIGLARGYQNRPDLTAERFIPNPFSNSEGQRMYKSGDLAKYLPDGKIVFLGRIDNQVKFRGFRIELEEIEAHLNEHPNIQHSLVLARKAKNGEQKLVAYYVTTKMTNGQDLALKKFLHKYLPDFMVPSTFIKLDKFPLTPNNKIDRKALPEFQGPQTAGSIFIKPQSGIEKQIAGIWKDILAVDKVGLNDNFFDLGGHSLNVIQVQTKVKENFDKEISIVDLFKYPTVKSFADYLINGNSVAEAFEDKLKRSNMQRGNIAMQRERMKMRGKTK